MNVTALDIAKDIAKNNKCYTIRKRNNNDWGYGEGIVITYKPYYDKNDIDPFEINAHIKQKYALAKKNGTLDFWITRDFNRQEAVVVEVTIWPVDKEKESKNNKDFGIVKNKIADFHVLVASDALGRPNAAYRRWMLQLVVKTGRKFKVKVEKPF